MGVSSGGTIDPKTGEVWEAKPIVPDHVGTRFDAATFGVPTIALNDGLATAWGVACRPEFVGKRIAVLALGTGVGCGAVLNHRLVMGQRGEYPRLNDVSFGSESFEALLGGASLTSNPSDEDRDKAIRAANSAVKILTSLYIPDIIWVTGSVGKAPWLLLDKPIGADLRVSPSSQEDGLFGAAMLALFPPA